MQSDDDDSMAPLAKRMKRTRNGQTFEHKLSPTLQTTSPPQDNDSDPSDYDEDDDDGLSETGNGDGGPAMVIGGNSASHASTSHIDSMGLDHLRVTDEVREVRKMEMNSAKKVKERARRGKMSESVRSLRILVPGCLDEKKVNQSQVLANAVTYISKIQAQLQSLQRESEKMKSQLQAYKTQSDPSIQATSSSTSNQTSSQTSPLVLAGSRTRGGHTVVGRTTRNSRQTVLRLTSNSKDSIMPEASSSSSPQIQTVKHKADCCAPSRTSQPFGVAIPVSAPGFNQPVHTHALPRFSAQPTFTSRMDTGDTESPKEHIHHFEPFVPDPAFQAAANFPSTSSTSSTFHYDDKIFPSNPMGEEVGMFMGDIEEVGSWPLYHPSMAENPEMMDVNSELTGQPIPSEAQYLADDATEAHNAFLSSSRPVPIGSPSASHADFNFTSNSVGSLRLSASFPKSSPIGMFQAFQHTGNTTFVPVYIGAASNGMCECGKAPV